jgi:hypothetical protein
MATTNLLLTRLPRDVYARIEPDLKMLSLKAGHVLHRPGDEINDLYFPTTCMMAPIWPKPADGYRRRRGCADRAVAIAAVDPVAGAVAGRAGFRSLPLPL